MAKRGHRKQKVKDPINLLPIKMYFTLSLDCALFSFCVGCSREMCVLALLYSSGKESWLAEKALGNS